MTRALEHAFEQAMARLAPFEPAPRLAAAVSGGADSMALALLAARWAARRRGTLLALIVDHRLRPESGMEAAVTAKRLRAHGISAEILCIRGLSPGPGLPERAREWRYRLLCEACERLGILHLLLGHHAADQAETVAIRAEDRSGHAGLAGMSALVELHDVRLLRPLLGVSPGVLRDFLRTCGIAWVEDPSNRDLRATRPRIRAGMDDATQQRLLEIAGAAGHTRVEQETRVATILAERAMIRPEGFAELSLGAIEPAALAALVQAISGRPFPPRSGSLARMAAQPGPGTLAGIRMIRSNKRGAGLLIVREEAALEPPIAAEPGTLWDGRFRLSRRATVPAGATIGALGADTVRFRAISSLPAAVLRTLPAIRNGNSLAAVPHLLYPDYDTCSLFRLAFTPRRSVAGAPFLPV